MEEVQEEHDANQETRNPPKLGLVSKIQRMFCWTDEDADAGTKQLAKGFSSYDVSLIRPSEKFI